MILELCVVLELCVQNFVLTLFPHFRLVYHAVLDHSIERCPPRQKKRSERLKAKVEALSTQVTVDFRAVECSVLTTVGPTVQSRCRADSAQITHSRFGS